MRFILLVFFVCGACACPTLGTVYCNITRCDKTNSTCLYNIYTVYSDGIVRKCDKAIVCGNTEDPFCSDMDRDCQENAKKYLYTCSPDCHEISWGLYLGLGLFVCAFIAVCLLARRRYEEEEKIEEIQSDPEKQKIEITPILIEEGETLTMEISCNICLTYKRDTVFQPCGHFLVCLTCAKKLESCPVCRSKIIDRISVYTS